MHPANKTNYRPVSIVILLITVSILLLPANGQARTLLAVYMDWFPYTYQENGKESGFEIEILKAVMKKMKVSMNFQRYPWNRCVSSLKNGEADILVSLLRTKEREQFIHYPDHHISISKTVFFTAADKRIPFSGSYEELIGYIIGVISGFSYGDVFDHTDYLTKEPVKNTDLLIGKVLCGRNDIGVENLAVITAYACKMNIKEKIRFLKTPIHSQKLYVGFSKKNELEQLCKNFSKFLGEYKKSNEYGAILQKYGIAPVEMQATEGETRNQQ